MSACGDCHGKDCQNTELDKITYDEEQDEILEFLKLYVKILHPNLSQWESLLSHRLMTPRGQSPCEL